MSNGKPFEVSKEVYDRARANCTNPDATYFYMTGKDKEELFSESIRYGYGLYSCMVHKEGDKYICTYEIGDSCD